MSHHAFIAVLILSAFGRLYAADVLNVNVTNWQITPPVAPSAELSVPLNQSWLTPTGLTKVTYQSTFKLPVGALTADDLYMIIPPIWCHNTVMLNNEVLSRSLVANIYASRIIAVPRSLIATSNTLTLELFGGKHQCKVRGKAVTITSDAWELFCVRLQNLFLNDVHQAITVINIIIIIFCISFVSVRELRQPIIVLSLALLAQIPHNLLTTDFYNYLMPSPDPTMPFYLQLAFQCFEWPMALFFYYLTLARGTGSSLPNRKYIATVGFIAVCGLMTSLLIYIDREIFHTIFNLMITGCMLFFFSLFFSLRTNRLLALVYLLSLVAFSCSAASELWGLNLYLMGHGWLLMSSIALFLIISKLGQSYRLSLISNSIVTKFMPPPCYEKMHHEIEKRIRHHSLDDAEVIAHVSGKGFISTILIDICDWGILSSFERSQLQPKLIYQARLRTFSEIEKIARKFNIHLIKSQGDNLKYCGGLYCENENREHIVADSSLEFIIEIINAIDSINADLRTSNLPYFEIKISASMGSNEYGIEQYLDRIQFDTIGDEVNIAYRLESGMDGPFYQQYGKNVALVHESLLAFCSKPSLIEKFSTSYIVQDKHKGYEYRCKVYLLDKREVRLGELAQQLGNFFVPMAPEATLPGPADARRSADEVTSLSNADKRSISRQNSYIGENLIAFLVVGEHVCRTEIIDYSAQSIGVVMKKEECPAELTENREIEVCFKVLDQQFSSKGIITRVMDNVTIRNNIYRNAAIKLIAPERISAEREFERFAVKPDVYPTASAQSPFSLRNRIAFKVTQISREGLALEPIDPGSHGLLVGLTLDLAIFCPLAESVSCRVRIQHISFEKEKAAVIGVRVVENKDVFSQTMALYLLNFSEGNLTLTKMRQAGFSVNETKQALSIIYKRTAEDEIKIALLRSKILQEAGQWEKCRDPFETFDSFDKRARHVMVMHNESCVAAARVVFNDGDPQNVEHLSYGAKIPDWLLAKKFVEFSRVCIQKDYRNSDVFLRLLYHMGKLTVESGNEWVLMSCNERLMKYYKRFGFQSIGEFGESGQRWLLGACNMKAAIEGSLFLPVGYAVAFEQASGELKEQGVLDKNFFALVNSGVMKSLKPVILHKQKQAMQAAEKTPRLTLKKERHAKLPPEKKEPLLDTPHRKAS